MVAGRPARITLTVTPTPQGFPADARLLTVTVGRQAVAAESVDIGTTMVAVTFTAPAFANGTGEREVKVFGTSGNNLIPFPAPRLGYLPPDQPGPVPMTAMALLVLTAPLLLLAYDIRKAYAFASQTRGAIIVHAAGGGLTAEELRLLLTELGHAPPGIPGLARTLMSFTLMLIVAVALFYVLFSGSSEVPEVVDKTLTVMTTALTTVIAFYFGARTAATQATQVLPPGPPSPAPGGTLSFQPAKAPAGTPVTISGSRFGTPAGQVLFGAQSAPVRSWSNTSIVVDVPAGLIAGQRYVVAVIPAGLPPLSSGAARFEAQ